MRSLNCFRRRICCVAKETVVFRSIIQFGVLFAAYLIYTKYKIHENLLFSDAQQIYVVPQGSVISDTKDHALFLTIHLDTDASPRECLQSIGRIQRFVTTICPPHLCQDEILYGVGFGFDFFRKINPDFESKGIERFEYRERSGAFGTLPNTGKSMFRLLVCYNDCSLTFFRNQIYRI
ncbi:unnamed protein product [Schistosoma turkestanicum]|nr:unnamed protein product [Schistosoma turkestanicum]